MTVNPGISVTWVAAWAMPLRIASRAIGCRGRSCRPVIAFARLRLALRSTAFNYRDRPLHFRSRIVAAPPQPQSLAAKLSMRRPDRCRCSHVGYSCPCGCIRCDARGRGARAVLAWGAIARAPGGICGWYPAWIRFTYCAGPSAVPDARRRCRPDPRRDPTRRTRDRERTPR